MLPEGESIRGGPGGEKSRVGLDVVTYTTPLQFQHLRGRIRKVAVSSDLAWSTWQVPGHPGLHNKKPVSTQ